VLVAATALATEVIREEDIFLSEVVTCLISPEELFLKVVDTSAEDPDDFLSSFEPAGLTPPDGTRGLAGDGGTVDEACPAEGVLTIIGSPDSIVTFVVDVTFTLIFFSFPCFSVHGIANS